MATVDLIKRASEKETTEINIIGRENPQQLFREIYRVLCEEFQSRSGEGIFNAHPAGYGRNNDGVVINIKDNRVDEALKALLREKVIESATANHDYRS